MVAIADEEVLPEGEGVRGSVGEEPAAHDIDGRRGNAEAPDNLIVAFQPPVKIRSSAFHEAILVHDSAVIADKFGSVARMDDFDAVQARVDEPCEKRVVQRAARVRQEGVWLGWMTSMPSRPES